MNNAISRSAVSAVAMLAGLLGTGAAAQEANDASLSGLEDIVVTAQRRSENLMDVPVAISAFSAQTLERSGITNIQSLQVATPTLVYTITGPYAQPFIRGVGSRLLQNGLDPSVATYVDGRYLSRQSSITLDLADIQRVEVLKGPQGVLFGRNASAGAIRIITNEVSDQSEGTFKIGYGNYNQLIAQAVANLPISDGFGIRVSGLTNQRDGYAKNIAGGRREWDDKNLVAVRGKARLEQGVLDANFTLSYWKQNDNFGNDTVALPPFQYHTGIARGGQTGVGLRYVASEVDQAIEKEELAGELDLKFYLGGITLSSISTFADLDNILGFDGDGTSTALVDGFAREKSKTYSQEFQLSSNKGPIDWIVGVYYFNDKTSLENIIDAGSGIISQGIQTVKSQSYAAFAQVGWQITDALKIIAGGRYTKDKKELSLNPSLTPGVTTVVPLFSDEASWSKFTPSATLEYSFADSMIYTKFARGFKSGGFNYPAAGQQPLNPEVLDMYELGLKSSLFDRTVRVTLSGYYYDYKDLQVSRASTAGSVLVITQNAANATLYGIDADLTWNVNRRLTLNAALAWQHSEYKNYDLATAKVFNGVVLGDTTPGMRDIPYMANGERLLRAPAFSAFASVNYDIPVGMGSVPVTVSYSYKGSFNFDFVANPTTDSLRHKPYHLVNARIGYRPDGNEWSVSAFANNLFDERYFDDVVAAGTGIRGSYGAPRTYGVEAIFNF